MTSPDLSRLVWRKSSRSNDNGGDCVEVAKVGDCAAIRDSKSHGGPIIVVPRRGWFALRAALAADQAPSA